jgi:hypothetical protein
MTAAGIVSLIVWNTLLIERRDRLVLGALPVRPVMRGEVDRARRLRGDDRRGVAVADVVLVLQV